jgi:hypothetical protein
MKTAADKDQVEYNGGRSYQSDQVATREVKTRARKQARTETTPISSTHNVTYNIL